MALLKNEAQEKAIKNINGPMIIISCPGSGKTTTLIRRIKTIIDCGNNPKKILMVTFTNSASRDMEKRYVEMYHKNPGVTFATIHSLCFNILKKEGLYNISDLLNEHDKINFFVENLKDIPEVDNPWTLSARIITEISVIKNNFINTKTYEPQSCNKDLFMSINKEYDKFKHENKIIDFDDMLIKTDELLTTNKKVLEKWQKRFDYIQCDEYQDTNYIQKNILYALAGNKKNLCVVGDDDQSIYRFRGADSSIMLDFNKDFPEAETIFMSTNYRSSQKIIDLADCCIKNNNKRFQKDFISQRGKEGEKGYINFEAFNNKFLEMAYISKSIKNLHRDLNIDYKDMAILFRNNKQASIPIFGLSSENIPYYSTEKVKTLYEEWMFEDIKSYIELSMGINEKINLMRVINRPNRFLNYNLFRNINYNRKDMLKAIAPLLKYENWKYESACSKINKLLDYFGPDLITKDTPTKYIFEALTKDGVNYVKFIKDSVKFRKGDLEEAMSEYEALKVDALNCKTVGNWFEYANKIIMTAEESRRKSNKNGVTLTTMHKSKGMEWKVVFVMGTNDSILPNKQIQTIDDLEEERRLFYVAMTRAKDFLTITSDGEPSRFVEEALNNLKEKNSPKVEKKLAGANVYHKKFKNGSLVGYKNDIVDIKFGNYGVKSFKFPESFEKGILRYV